MSQPASTIVVTNNLLQPITCGGPNPQTIAPGANASWPAAQMPALCADVNFRAMFLSGGLSVAVNGQSLPTPTTSPQVSTFLDNIANQLIVLT